MVVFQLGKLSRKRENIERIRDLDNIVQQEELTNNPEIQSFLK